MLFHRLVYCITFVYWKICWWNLVQIRYCNRFLSGSWHLYKRC